jgi:2-phosphosulfolactate phosphatase
MHITHVTLDDAAHAGGLVVVVDVLRAFTLAALALGAGARAIRCVATVEEALALRQANPGSLAMGEHHHGRRVPGFDLGNSPTELADADVDGRLLIHRTSAGTQGLVRAAAGAAQLFAASFVCAGATARAVQAAAPEQVTFVSTGVDHRDGDEDIACAEYIAALLTSPSPVDPATYLARVAAADAAQSFLGDDADFPRSDLDHAVRLDAVDFALRAQVQHGNPTLVAQRPDAA